tara:strand:+ start:185 stop:322 length:138 start_codon:yes stop_codon:yes gene_type:complete
MEIDEDKIARLVLTTAYAQALAEQLSVELGQVKKELAKYVLEEKA